MKIKIIYVVAGFLLGMLVAAIIVIDFVNLSVFKGTLIFNGALNITTKYEDNYIPDEATAIRVAEAILDATFGTEYKVGSEMRVDFIEHQNAWRVAYAGPLLEDGEIRLASGGWPAIYIRKDNGMVLSIGLQQD